MISRHDSPFTPKGRAAASNLIQSKTRKRYKPQKKTPRKNALQRKNKAAKGYKMRGKPSL